MSACSNLEVERAIDSENENKQINFGELEIGELMRLLVLLSSENRCKIFRHD